MPKVKVDREKCIGCGACEAVCGKVFQLRNGKAVVKKEDVGEEEVKECIGEAKDSCPVGAISLS